METVNHGTEQYDGQAFCETLTGGKSSGRLALNATHLSFDCGSHSVALPLSDLVLKLGGANKRLVFFSHPAYPQWSVYTPDRSILKSPHLMAHPELLEQVNTARGTRILGWGGFAAGVMLVVILPLLLLMNMDTLSGWLAPSIPAEYEQKMGEAMWEQVEGDSEILDNPEVTEPLERMLAPLLAAVDDKRYPFHVRVVDTNELNAFALPGGYIALNSGLILAAESREEVLGVLAHEIVHVTEQHGVRSVLGTAGIVVVVQALFGDFTGVLGLLVDAGPVLLRMGYSRDFEAEADDKGFDLLVKAGIDPIGLPKFFKLIIKKEKDKDKAQGEQNEQLQELAEFSEQYLSTHPQTQARIDALEKRRARLTQTFEHTEIDFLALKQAVREAIAAKQNQ